jgi:hypothetical protein
LPITRGILEAHGGTIWVESEGYDEVKLTGSTFHILLPTRSEASNPEITQLFSNQERPMKDTENSVQENT